MGGRVLSVGRMPRVGGLAVPLDFYTVIDEPALLAGMRYPDRRAPWPALAEAGFRWVVCLTSDRPDYEPHPLSFLAAVELEDLYGGFRPDNPNAEVEKLDGVVAAILRRLSDGEGILVHCAGGTGRTGTVLGAVLRSLGRSPKEVAGYLGRVNRARGRDWPESPWQGEYVSRLALPVQSTTRVRCRGPEVGSGGPRSE
jgi:hypothetical protein